MVKPNRYLIAGGVISALLSTLHILLALKPELYSYIAPGGGAALTQMAVQGSYIITIATAALAVMFALWAIYAFSGAGLVGRLPLIKVALVAIGVIYVLRALFLPSEISMVLNQGYPARFVVFSTISLVAGTLYLIGYRIYRAS